MAGAQTGIMEQTHQAKKDSQNEGVSGKLRTMFNYIRTIFWGGPVRKLVSVLSGLLLAPAWVFNFENWLSVNGYDKLLTDSESPILGALGWLAGLLSSSQPRWFISGTIIALIAEGLWRFWSSREEIINSPLPDGDETGDLGEDALPNETGSAWAFGLKHISAKHAACAFASTSPDQYKNAPKAWAIYNQIKSSAEIGYIPTLVALERSTTKGDALKVVRVQNVDAPWANERIDFGTMMPVEYMQQYFHDMPWDFSWIVTDSDVSGQSPPNIEPEIQP